MELIVAAAFCSVLVSILLKVCKLQGFNPMQMIIWNYVSASVLCFYWFKPNLSTISLQHTPWWLILSLGVLLPSVFLALAKSLDSAGILKTEIAQRLSVVLSLAAAYFIFQENFSQLKIVGISLGIVAVLCILYSHRAAGQSAKAQQGIIYLGCVWLGYALIDVLLKYSTGLGLQFAVALNLMFVCAFVLAMVYILIRDKSMGSMQNISAGLILGALNFANIALYVKAHMLLKDSPAVVFAGMNILVVLFGVISGVLFFKEKLKSTTTIGLG